jgi:hypothetical protein
MHPSLGGSFPRTDIAMASSDDGKSRPSRRARKLPAPKPSVVTLMGSPPSGATDEELLVIGVRLDEISEGLDRISKTYDRQTAETRAEIDALRAQVVDLGARLASASEASATMNRARHEGPLPWKEHISEHYAGRIADLKEERGKLVGIGKLARAIRIDLERRGIKHPKQPRSRFSSGQSGAGCKKTKCQ